MTEIEITKASEVKVREIEWLWYPYIPFGKITVVQGDAGDGKSTFVLNLAAMLSRGQPMPFTDGTGQPPINIIYQSSEDDADDTIVPRFISAGGDPERLLFISEKERYSPYAPLFCPHHRQGPLVLQGRDRRATGPCEMAGQVL